MAPLAIPLGEHPDGDPFAEQDRAAFANSRLGQMEQRWARVEREQQQQQQATTTTTRGSTAAVPKSTTTTESTTRRASGRVQGNKQAAAAAAAAAKRSSPADVVVLDHDDNELVDETKDKDGDVKMDEDDKGSEQQQQQTTEPAERDQVKSGVNKAAAGDEEDIADTGDEDEDEDEEEEEEDGASSVQDSEDERQVAAQMRGENLTAHGNDGSGDDDEEDDDEDDGADGEEAADERDETEEQDGGNDEGDVSMVDASVDQTRESSPSGTTTANKLTVSKGPSRLSRAASSTSLTSIDSTRQSSPPLKVQNPGNVKSAEGPDASNGETSADAQPVKTSTKRRRSEAQSAVAPAKPKPTFAKQQGTIRIEISLPTPGSTTDVPRFSVVEKARDAGFIADEEELAEGEGKSEHEDSDDSGIEDGKEGSGPKAVLVGSSKAADGQAELAAQAPKKRKRGKNAILGRWGGYDTEDPFVDDSELNLYEPKYYVPPKRKGFFVCTGAVEVERKTGRRGRVPGTKNKPKTDADPKASTAAVKTPGADVKPAIPAFGGSPGPSKREGFSPELQKQLDMLKEEVAKESFEVKSKFPPRLKPILVNVAMLAVELGEYDDEFFAILPKIFPYNNFTMKKLVKREVFPQRIERLKAEIDSQLVVLKKGVDEAYPRQRAEFEASVAKWEVEYAQYQEEKAKKGPGGTWIAPDANGGGTSTRATPEPGTVAPIAAVTGTPVDSSAAPNDARSTPQPANEDPDAPVKPKWKFRFNDDMREALLRMVDADDEISNLTIEKQGLEKAAEKGEKLHSTMVQRRELYARIAALWPPGEIHTNQLSREMSAFKNKMKRKEGQD
ncbi:hypothetical protein ACM66B_001306 [Microbotryomycetes sp. NB124-2]